MGACISIHAQAHKHTHKHTHTRTRARAIHDIFLGRRAMQQKNNERMAFQRRISLGDFDNRNVLVLDESSVGKNMSCRLRGYGRKGQRVRWYDYFAQWNTDGCTPSTLTHKHTHTHGERERERERERPMHRTVKKMSYS